MKLCPNPRCPHRVRRGAPAEYLDRADVCSDCTMTLVDASAYGSVDAQRAVTAWHEARESAAADVRTTDGSRRLDLVTGISLIALSVVLVVGSYSVAVSTGGGTYFVALGPLVYGVVRLVRGLGPTERGKPAARDEGPYR